MNHGYRRNHGDTTYQGIYAKVPEGEVLWRQTLEQLIRDKQAQLQEFTQLTD